MALFSLVIAASLLTAVAVALVGRLTSAGTPACLYVTRRRRS